MNFLAHAVLAGRAGERVAGSLAGDFVKGVLYEKDYPKEFLLGLRLHRRIDAFSNLDAGLKTSANRLPAHLRRIAPPCIDMMADHFLALEASQNPKAYLPGIAESEGSASSLTRYEDALHVAIEPYLELLDDRARRFFEHARSTRLFSNYESFERTARGLGYVCERLGQPSNAPLVVDALANQRDALFDDFLNYWPNLQAEAERFLHAP